MAEQRPAPPPTDGTAASPGEQRLTRLVKVLTEAASLVALATALLVYFGWRRTAEQARRLGAEVSVFELSPQDYVLRSVDVVLVPALFALLLALLGFWAHRRIVRGRHARHVAAVMRRSWLVPLVVGVPLLALRPADGNLAFPFLFAFAVAGTWYGMALRASVAGRRWQVPFPVLAALAALMAVSFFWMAERIARVGGEARIEEIKADVAENLPAVAVYSAQRLQLADADVAESVLEEADATASVLAEVDATEPVPAQAESAAEGAYRFRYDGLYLLQQSAGKHFLLTGDWSPGRGRLVVLPDDPTIRLEFGPGAVDSP